MTVSEDNRHRTEATDQAPERPEAQPHERGGTGRTLREALEEARVRPGDFEEREGQQS